MNEKQGPRDPLTPLDERTPLWTILLERNAEVVRLERALSESEACYERVDLALAAAGHKISRRLSRGEVLMHTTDVIDLLGALGCFGSCARRTGPLGDMLEAFEEELGR